MVLKSKGLYYYDNLSPEEEAFVIKKLNNGKAMTSVEKALVGAKSYPIYKELRSHNLFKKALTENAMNKSTYAEIIVKTWILLYGDNICFDKKVFEPTMQNVIISEEQKQMIKLIFDRIEEVSERLAERKENKRKNKKIAKLILKKIHMLSIVPVVAKTINDDIEIEKLIDWITHFFSAEGKVATNNEIYNENSKTGTGHTASIKARNDAIEKSWNDFLK